MDDQIFLSKREAARMLSISVRTVDNLIGRKELSARRVGRRVLIPRKALEEFTRRDHPTRGPLATRSGKQPETAEAKVQAPKDCEMEVSHND